MATPSVIVPTFDRPSYLRDALISLLEQDLPPEEYEIIVVDNGPCAEAKQVVEEVNENRPRTVRYIREPMIGLHNARHAGARAARGRILIYVDDDVIVHNGWLAAMMQPFANPQVACVGGKVVPRWEAEPPPWWSQFNSAYLSILDLGDEQLELSWPRTIFGCNMSVRASVLHEVGGFNPDALGDRRLIWLRGDGETGLQKKLYDAGHKVIYQPSAWLYHRIPPSRLRPEYFYWRAFIQGISDSYSHMRTYTPSVLGLLRHAGRCRLNAARVYLDSLRESDRRIRSRARAAYWRGRGQHQLRLALSPRLRRHALRDRYL